MDIKQELGQYRRCFGTWLSLVDEERQLRSLAEKITAALGGMPGGTGDRPDKVGMVLEGIEKALDKIGADQCELSARRAAVLTLVNSVPDERERAVLRYAYINGYSWREISARTGYDERHVRRLHQRALEFLEMRKN